MKIMEDKKKPQEQTLETMVVNDYEEVTKDLEVTENE